MERSDFLSTLNTASQELQTTLGANTNNWLADLIADPTDDKGDTKFEIDSIYEIMCYFSLAADLSKKCQLEYKEGIKTCGFRVPYRPADKSNFMFFRFEHLDTPYDLCCGTAVYEQYDRHKEHPDISLQRMDSTADGEPGNVVAIWDAKHHQAKKKAGNSKLTKSDFTQMFFWCDAIEIASYENGDVLVDLFPREFQVCAVVTNAGSGVSYENNCMRNGFSMVYGFHGVGTSEPTPSRADQLNYQLTHSNQPSA